MGQQVLVNADAQCRLADGASRSFLESNADEVDVEGVAILGGSGAVTSAADRAIQEALGIR